MYLPTHYVPCLRSTGGLRARHGNTLILALGVLALAAAMIAISSESATQTLTETRNGRYQALAKAAVEAVLARREQVVIELAKGGDPQAFADWDDNYGLEFFGDCEVRWKVEPVRSVPKDRLGNYINFVTNPSADPNWPVPATKLLPASTEPAWRPNDTVYLFRVAADGRYLQGSGATGSTNSEYLARAQGARYVAVFKEPLFRYVIFYAQTGPLGDLELSHGPAIKVMGNVHSNGSIYFGAGTEALNWSAVTPTNGDTQIGPQAWSAAVTYNRGDRVWVGTANYECIATSTTSAVTVSSDWLALTKDVRVRVTGVDGIFRLAKPAMYGFFNGFNMANPTAGPAAPTSSHYVTGSLISGNTLNSLEGSLASAGTTDIEKMTRLGALVNPYRVTQDSKLITRPGDTSPDTKRRMNGVPLVGGWSTPDAGNDSRDEDRSPAEYWTKESLKAAPIGFGGFVRTSITSGRVKQLSDELKDRPLEAHKLFYRDNPVVMTPAERQAYFERGPDHQSANPGFITPGTKALTSDFSTIAAGQIIEQPGYYLERCLGGEFAMSRKMDATQGFIGWTVVNEDGTAIPAASIPETAGIVVRERAVPDFTYFGNNTDPVSATTNPYIFDKDITNADFIPYAYGKHKDTVVWPFTEMWVSGAGTGWNAPVTTGDDTFVALDTNHISTDKTYTTQRYTSDLANKGRLSITAIARSGAQGTTPTDTPANLNMSNRDIDGFFRDNWRFIHLKRSLPQIVNAVGPQVDTTSAANYYDLMKFDSAQCRILPDAAGAFFTGGNTAAKVAMMIRPINPLGTGSNINTNLSTSGVNSRAPFAAITFSPVTGIATQRRVTMSQPTLISQFGTNVYYTGENDPLKPDAPGTSTAAEVIVVATVPQNPVDATYGPPALVTPNTNTVWSWRVNQSQSFPGFSKSFSITTGEGLKVSPTYWFNTGPNVWTCQYRYQKYSNAYYERTRTADGRDGYEDFILDGTQDVNFQVGMTSAPSAVGWTDGWATLTGGRSLHLATGTFSNFAVVPPAGTTRSVAIQTNQSSNNTDPFISPRPIGFVSGRGFLNATTYRVAWPAERRWTFQGNNSERWSATVDTPVASTSQGTASTLWMGWSDYNNAKNWFISIGKTEADLQDKLGSYTYSNAAAQDYPLNPGAPAGLANTAAPAPSNVVAITASALPPAAGGPYRVAVLKQGTTEMRLETNSWISQRGSWFSAPTANNNKLILSAGMSGPPLIPPVPELLLPQFTTNPGTTQSFRPDQWTGASEPPIANWLATSPLNSMNDPLNGAVTWYHWENKAYQVGSYAPVPQLNAGAIPPAHPGYSGTNNPPLWEDAPVPRWVTGTNYVAASSIVWYNRQFWKCVVSHAAATVPSTTNAQWSRADYIYLRMERIAGGTNGILQFKFYINTVAPTVPYAPAQWRTVTGALARLPDGTPNDPVPTQLVIPDSWVSSGSCPALIGIAVQSSNYYNGVTSNSTPAATGSTNPVTVNFTNLQINETVAGVPTVHDSAEWEGSTKAKVSGSAVLAGRLVDNQTSYLCSQYQVFWGPVDITEDFFSYTRALSGVDADRIAREQVFYNPRFFWSQSRWWNEGDLQSDYSGPQVRTNWVDKETGYSTTGATAYNTANAPVVPPKTGVPAPIYKSPQKELMAKTTVLNIDLQAFQDYLKNRSLIQAAYQWSSNNSQGVTSGASVGASWTGLLYVARTNRYPRNPNPTGANPYNPALPNSSVAAGGDTLDVFSGYGTAPTAAQQRMQAHLVAANAVDRGILSAPIPWQDFHHGVMVSNGADINWKYVSSAVTKFGQGKMTIASPNTVYIHGDLNNTRHDYIIQSATKAKYTPMAVMGDSITMLSNSWNINNYRITAAPLADGYLGVTSNARVSTLNTHVLNRPKGTAVVAAGTPSTKTTAYRTCLLTNNQPTTKYRAFQDEGAPFINTMMFVEDWETNAATMEYTGSLVVFDTCRYNRTYLLQDPKINGRSPFGLMGWNVNAAWAGITGNSGTVPDWCKSGSTGLTSLFDGSANPNGSLPVYAPPIRNLSFNDDLLTEDGTPPETPFGVTAAGVAGWVRVVE